MQMLGTLMQELPLAILGLKVDIGTIVQVVK